MRSAGRCSGRGPRTQSPPRPRRPRRSKKSADVVAAEAAAHPDVPVEVVCADAHRLGPKPVLRSVWAPKGERPVGLGHHRFTWRYVMAVVAPASGETVWPLSNGVSKALFAGLLDAFAREVGAGPGNRVVVLLDNRGSTPGPTSSCRTASGWSTCHPIALNCSAPRRSGPWWTNPSSTGSSPISTTSPTPSQNGVATSLWAGCHQLAHKLHLVA